MLESLSLFNCTHDQLTHGWKDDGYAHDCPKAFIPYNKDFVDFADRK
jgi:hypothetical protein